MAAPPLPGAKPIAVIAQQPLATFLSAPATKQSSASEFAGLYANTKPGAEAALWRATDPTAVAKVFAATR